MGNDIVVPVDIDEAPHEVSRIAVVSAFLAIVLLLAVTVAVLLASDRAMGDGEAHVEGARAVAGLL